MQFGHISITGDKLSTWTFTLSHPTAGFAYSLVVAEQGKDVAVARFRGRKPSGKTIETRGDGSSLDPAKKYQYQLEENGSIIRMGTCSVLRRIK